jgi:hypothetical protein
MESDSDLILLKEDIEESLKYRKKTSVSLNLKERIEEREENKKRKEQLENEKNDSDEDQDNEDRDINLYEAADIATDYKVLVASEEEKNQIAKQIN